MREELQEHQTEVPLESTAHGTTNYSPLLFDSAIENMGKFSVVGFMAIKKLVVYSLVLGISAAVSILLVINHLPAHSPKLAVDTYKGRVLLSFFYTGILI